MKPQKKIKNTGKPPKKINPAAVAKALGATNVMELSAKTGLSAPFLMKILPKREEITEEPIRQPSTKPQDFTLDELVEEVIGDKKFFFDAHPGLMGCPVPLPEKVRLAAAAMEHSEHHLSEALAIIREAAAGYGMYACVTNNLKLDDEGRYFTYNIDEGTIQLEEDRPDGMRNVWSVIKWKTV